MFLGLGRNNEEDTHGEKCSYSQRMEGRCGSVEVSRTGSDSRAGPVEAADLIIFVEWD